MFRFMMSMQGPNNLSNACTSITVKHADKHRMDFRSHVITRFFRMTVSSFTEKLWSSDVLILAAGFSWTSSPGAFKKKLPDSCTVFDPQDIFCMNMQTFKISWEQSDPMIFFMFQLHCFFMWESFIRKETIAAFETVYCNSTDLNEVATYRRSI